MKWGNVSKSDRRAILFLGSLAVVLMVALLVTDIIVTVKTSNSIMSKETLLSKNTDEAKSKTFHTFDPNTVDSATLAGFGIKSWKVRNFIHYRDKGARFATPESILRTYGWEEEDLLVIQDYIVIGDQYKQKNYLQERQTYKAQKTNKREENVKFRTYNGNNETYERKYAIAKFHSLTKINPNTADTTLLCSIPGIGTKISQAIIRYRDKLGGYVNKEQLGELSIVSPELLEWFEIPTNYKPQKININKASFQILSRHPYIGYDRTKDLMVYRRLYGDINNIEELIKTGIFTKEEAEKAAPYLEWTTP